MPAVGTTADLPEQHGSFLTAKEDLMATERSESGPAYGRGIP
jgi:hypothetical protein